MLNKCSPVALSISGAQTHSRDSLWSTLQVGSEAPLWEQGRGPDPTSCRPLQEHQWPGHKVRNPQGSFPPNCLRIQPSPVRGCLGGGPGRSTPVHHSSQQRGGLDCQSVLGWSPETSPGPRGPTPSCSELRLPLQTRRLTSLLHEAEQVVQEFLPLGVSIQLVQLRGQGGDRLVGVGAQAATGGVLAPKTPLSQRFVLPQSWGQRPEMQARQGQVPCRHSRGGLPRLSSSWGPRRPWAHGCIPPASAPSPHGFSSVLVSKFS